MSSKDSRILSGMRPTGKLHLGHLVGALDNWVRLQEDNQCFFMVADWHALMSEYECPSVVSESTFDNLIDWLAAGIDPAKSIIFIQSEVKEHLDLYMLFSCLTPLGWLERCPTYKEQLRQLSDRNVKTYGFLGYPVLQAADILLYKANKVPVGEDQLPHLELTREIARRVNGMYKKDIFPDPQALLTESPRLLGLDNRKMSKSFNNSVNLSDTADSVRKKIQNMITDPKRIKLGDPGHPKECNVFSYYKVFLRQREKEAFTWCTDAQKGCIECKTILAEALIEKISLHQEKRKKWTKDKAGLEQIIKDGRLRASQFAGQTLKELKQAMGIL
ncbi:MAG: tryptophan--tRNA ligase [Candidatus Omnitrophica bacterium]|nr:tryptophan--tRNA ligase [Candidatus Omnitrophota bacterium]MBU1871838.1 tryptophan--tRNA ligase [Candidatus Omnitrophota bacterium]